MSQKQYHLQQYVTYGRTAARRRQHRMADGLRHTKLLSHQRLARVEPCQREAAAKPGKVMPRRVGTVQMQHR